jgi:DDE_Tnp_1-associated
VDSSSLIEAVRRHLGGGKAPDPGVLRRALEARLTDRRKPQGLRHELGPAVSVLVAGVACGHQTARAIGQAAAGWGQEVLAAHGCRVRPSGLRVAPSERTLYRIPQILDPDELEAALTGALADAALDPQVTAAAAAKRQAERGKIAKKKRKPPAAEEFREVRADGWFRPHPVHPWLDPAVTGDPGHVPARHGVAVDGKERKGAKAGGNKKVHLLAAVTHTPGIVIAQDRVAKSGKANEISHFRPLLEPLPLENAVVTTDAMQTNRGNARFLREDKKADYLLPVLGNQPALNEQLNAPALGQHPGRRRHQRDHPRPDRDPHRQGPALPRGHRIPGRAPGCPHRAVHHVQEERPVAHPRRGRPLHHQPRRRPGHARGPPRPCPRPLAG